MENERNRRNRKNREAADSGRIVNAPTTRVESTPRVDSRERVHSSQISPTSKYSYILCFSKQTDVHLNLTSSLAKTVLKKKNELIRNVCSADQLFALNNGPDWTC